jgi:hypothetical protein
MEKLISQLTKAQELIEDLKNSLNKDCISNAASFQSMNLSQEIILKLRRFLDQLINGVFICQNLTVCDKFQTYKLYYPIFLNLELFSNWTKKYSFNKDNIIHMKFWDYYIFKHLKTING